jgi:ABC-type polysaccharide/polyol phosphate transport system ATPase subunit/SAM-dependent methyltransferase
VSVVIAADQLSKRFLLKHNRMGSLKERFLSVIHRNRRETVEAFWALQQVSMEIAEGEAVGVIGRNGSGKSTLLRLVAGIHHPTSGRLLVRRGARIRSMIELGVGFHPELTGIENLRLNAAVHGLSREQIDAIHEPVIEFSGLRSFMDIPLKNYSSGMIMRLGFAVAVNLDPDILLLDEIFAVGDADFQTQCIATIRRFRDDGGTILFVSHGEGAVKVICDRVCLLEKGQLVFDGSVDRGFVEYRLMLDAGSARLDPAAQAQADPAPTPSRHRQLPGGCWEEAGAWQFEVLRQAGLRPGDSVLDIGCGSLAAGRHLLRYLGAGHYCGVESDQELVNAGLAVELAAWSLSPDLGRFIVDPALSLASVSQRFRFAIGLSLFSRLPLHAIARVIVDVVKHLEPGGRFYATWFDNPDPTCFEPIARAGVRTYAGGEPYHHSFAVIAGLCDAIGARAARADAPPHPAGEGLMVITAAPAPGSTG